VGQAFGKAGSVDVDQGQVFVVMRREVAEGKREL